ncbi:hypothetical protein DMZ48_14105 [Robertkochia solimangrovi]|nr:hypothetical protein DMZ48_14105 [Robertkochia solimangrovi]
MKTKLTIFSTLFLFLFSCSNQRSENEIDNQKELTETLAEQKVDNRLPVTKDSLIAKLATMETDTLDCSADVYWQIIGKGKSYIPKLIGSLTDTTPTNIYHGCKKEKLNIGELSYFALEEIGDFPAFIVTQIQFDVIQINNGWHCWSFYDYLFDNRNKKEYQNKVKAFYEKSQFEFVEYPDSVITDCMKEYSIKGKLKWKE